MRMRKKKNGKQRFERCSYLAVENPADYKGKWSESFTGGESSLFLEIGCGKGDFATEMAKRNPNSLFIAVEKCFDALVVAMEKADKAQLKNIKFMWADAKDLREIFEDGELDRIYLNFSDPWKKAKQAKRRLTYRTFLEIYKHILKKEGRVEFKTDNRPLFDFSLEEFESFGAKVEDLTFDLHNSPYNEGNIQTEYERNFSAKGFPINRCVVYF